MFRIVTDKSKLVGLENLVKYDDWIPLEDMNTDMKILQHPLFDNAFKQIVQEHKPQHRVAFLSLCTSTRPYHLGRKWKTYMDRFSGKSDLIVTSSGGVIPKAYWNSYPFLNYDGDSAPSANETYVKKLESRLMEFFSTHQYDYIVANFRPKMRNTPVVYKVFNELKEKGVITDFVVLPTEEMYKKLQDKGFPGGKMYPDLDDSILGALEAKIDEWSHSVDHVNDLF